MENESQAVPQQPAIQLPIQHASMQDIDALYARRPPMQEFKQFDDYKVRKSLALTKYNGLFLSNFLVPYPRTHPWYRPRSDLVHQSPQLRAGVPHDERDVGYALEIR